MPDCIATTPVTSSAAGSGLFLGHRCDVLWSHHHLVVRTMIGRSFGKGETYTVTLVLDSFFHNHHLSELKQWLRGMKSGGCSGDDPPNPRPASRDVQGCLWRGRARHAGGSRLDDHRLLRIRSSISTRPFVPHSGPAITSYPSNDMLLRHPYTSSTKKRRAQPVNEWLPLGYCEVAERPI